MLRPNTGSHILADAGPLLAIVVTAVNVPERDGTKFTGRCQKLLRILGDGCCRGKSFTAWIAEHFRIVWAVSFVPKCKDPELLPSLG
ncbi:hypothetical protein QZJ86_18080 [Methylomonas montana]|uniref:hypothetical protein n=1 Tax=Methylomonas montana TaxID=3058963 RepID=UPI00265AD1EE|nr:hypothetical protein [Methylomonas montana]WKJ89894.1 hypothetical protein QZJ86_18080 [Methylomonas montana]